MNYTQKLESIKTIKELYEFRDELRSDAKLNSDIWYSQGNDPMSEYLDKSRNANFFIKRVESTIEYYEQKFNFLPKIEEKKINYNLEYVSIDNLNERYELLSKEIKHQIDYINESSEMDFNYFEDKLKEIKKIQSLIKLKKESSEAESTKKSTCSN